MFITSGPLAPQDPIFIDRQTELEKVEGWLSRVTCVGALMGARQTGKTSLLLKVRHQNHTKYHCIFINLEAISNADEATCFGYICEELLQQLGMDYNITTMRPKNSGEFLACLRKIAPHIKKIRVVLMLDEIGALLPHDTAQKLAHSIRAAFTNRLVEEAYQRYVFILSGATEMLRLTTGESSPLRNVSESVYLSDFTSTQVETLISRGFSQEGMDKPSTSVCKRIYDWTNGHPYLTQYLGSSLSALKTLLNTEHVDTTVRKLLETEDKNLPHISRGLDGRPGLQRTVTSILRGASLSFSRSNPLHAELELLGVIKSNAAGKCTIRNRIYERMLETLEVQRIPKPAQMAAIPTPMYNRLCQTLLQCDPFDSHQTLQAIFINAKLITWRNQLPEATNRLQRVEATIAYLHDKYSAKQDNALISLLDVLRERISADDARHNELAGLASELTSTLTP